MHLVIPNSWGVDLREYNHCHGQDDGKFCSDRGGLRPGFVRKTGMSGESDVMFITAEFQDKWRYWADRHTELSDKEIDLHQEVKDAEAILAQYGEADLIYAKIDLPAMRTTLAALRKDLHLASESQKNIELMAKKAAILKLADELGFPRDRINIVNNPFPREFEVGGTKYHEGGHYQPATGEIEINIHNMRGRYLLGAVAHEIQHAKFEVFKTALEREGGPDGVFPWSEAVEKRDGTSPFRVSGDLKPEYRVEFREHFPAHAVIADTWGNGYVSKSLMDKMSADDGFTDYSKSYWKKAQERTGQQHWWVENYLGQRRLSGAMERAMDETMAEVGAWRAKNRFKDHKRLSHEAPPSREWRRLTARIIQFYRSYKKRDVNA